MEVLLNHIQIRQVALYLTLDQYPHQGEFLKQADLVLMQLLLKKYYEANNCQGFTPISNRMEDP